MDAKLYVCFMIEILGISFHEFVLRVFCGAVYFAVWLTHHCFLYNAIFFNKETCDSLLFFRCHKHKRSKCQTRWYRCQHWRSWGLCCTILVGVSWISRGYSLSHNQLEKSLRNNFSNWKGSSYRHLANSTVFTFTESNIWWYL